MVISGAPSRSQHAERCQREQAQRQRPGEGAAAVQESGALGVFGLCMMSAATMATMMENRKQIRKISTLTPRERFNGPSTFPVIGPGIRPQPDHHVTYVWSC